MAETCKGMMEKPLSSLVLIIPGLAFLAVGVLIVLEPRVLVWLVGAACVMLGIVLLMLAAFMRSIGARLRGAHDEIS